MQRSSLGGRGRQIRPSVAVAFVSFVLLLAASSAAGAGATLHLLDEAAARGDLSATQTLLYKLYAIKGSQKLPAIYQMAPGAPERCATEVMVEVARSFDRFTPAEQEEVLELMSRPTLDSFTDTAHFRVHYNTTGAVPFGWPSTTYLDAVKASVEASWTFYHTTKGWQVPPSDGTTGGGTNLIDCYIVDLGTGFYGITYPDAPVPGGFPQDYTAYFEIDNDYAGFGYPDPTVPMKITVAHEYHHVVQMGYVIGIPWWMENLSTFMEDEVYDSVDDNWAYLSCFLGSPYYPLDKVNGCFEYGHFLWPTYLKDAFDHQRTREVQLCAATAVNVLDCFDSVLAPYGSNLNAAANQFAVYNYYAGQLRDDGAHYAESGSYGSHLLAADRMISTYPQTNQHPTTSKRPAALGFSVIQLTPQVGSPDNKLTVSFNGPSCTSQVVLITKEPGAPVSHEHYMSLDANGDGSLSVTSWKTADTEYAFLIVSMARTCGAGTQDYSFDVTTSTSTGVDDAPPLYARTVDLRQNTPNPFRHWTRISYRLEAEGLVDLRMVDAAGREVRRLVHAHQPAGEQVVYWDGRDDAGRLLPPGIYFSTARIGGASVTRKMLRIE